MKQNICTFLIIAILLSLSLPYAAMAEAPLAWDELVLEEAVENRYADQFAITLYQGGYAKLSIVESGEYLLVPENMPVPAHIPEEVVVLQQPLRNVYLAASSAMDLICAIDALDRVSLSALKEEGWYVPAAKEAMKNGAVRYAGKYNAPDYEQILASDCGLAIESTMIYHTPEIKENLEAFGIPVLIERSSYESHPLGRMEWIRLYGILFGRRERADACFTERVQQITDAINQEPTGKTVAFFYVTSNGAINVRKSGDYLVKAIRLAGGEYIFPDLGGEENALSSMNMDPEMFYRDARDADVLIYNSTIDKEVQSVDELLQKWAMLADFKAVKEGQIYCTGKNMFQESMSIAALIQDIHTIVTDHTSEPLTILKKING